MYRKKEEYTMRIILSIFLLLTATTLALEEREAPHVGVHEWGVITWDFGEALAQSAPFIFQEAVTRAPVIYFHGPEFTGSFTVTVDNGQLIELYPTVAPWQPDSYTWSGRFSLDYLPLRDLSDIDRGLSAPSDFQWALEFWRIPETLTFNGDDGITEEFLYYESTLEDVTFLPLHPGSEIEPERSTALNLELLLLGMEDGRLMATTCTLARFAARSGMPLSWEMTVSDDGLEIRDIFYEWSKDLIDIEEVDALWFTWRDWFITDSFDGRRNTEDTVIAIYLMPQELTGSVSTLNLETEEGYPVDYSRYLLVAVPVTL